MKLIALMPVRNEAWCLGLTARVALMWCDSLILGLHACTDRSLDIAVELGQEYGSRVTALSMTDTIWDEMRHRQMLLDEARVQNATHIAIVDADEVLTGNLLLDGGPIQDFGHCCVEGAVESLGRGSILQLPGYNLRGSICRYHASGIWGQRWFSVAFADDPRLGWSGDRFHRREPVGLELRPYRPIAQGRGGVMHLWGASERRLRAKHAWYKVTERLRWPAKRASEIDAMYSWAINGRPQYGDGPQHWTYADVPESWWEPYKTLAVQYLDIDAEPWQEKAVRDAVAIHGRNHFAGLDLFGVV